MPLIGIPLRVLTRAYHSTDKKNVILLCPTCGKSKKVPRDETDPKGTAIVEIRCYDCEPGDFEEATYYSRAGTEVIPE